MKEQIKAVQRMQEYITAHLHEEISSANLANAACYSPWHSYRLFREYTGLTPSEYIRKLRLSHSALRLKNEDVKVIDVAYDLGFGSVYGYQRAFHKEFGCNPGEYEKEPVPISLFYPLWCQIQRAQKGECGNERSTKCFCSADEKAGAQVHH